VLESTGACGENVKKMLQVIGAFSNDCKAFVTKAMKIVNFELQRGNSMMANRAAVIARSRHIRSLDNLIARNAVMAHH
jgi:hypothetical protein